MEMTSNGDSSHAVIKIIVAQEVSVDIIDVVSHFKIEMEVWIASDKGAGHGRGSVAVWDGSELAELSLLSENVVVDIDEGGTSLGGKVAVELGFSFNNTFETAKSFEVGAAYIGDEAEVGIGDFTEGIDFTGVVGSHFDDGNLGVGGDGKEGERYAEMVIEVSSRGMSAVFF